LKSGAFKTVGDKFNMYKLHDHSHLYTQNQLLDFPGRRFKVIKTTPFNKKELQKLNLKKANITIRNFPISVAELRKKFKIKDGGEIYLFFTTNPKGEKIVVECHKI
ncbi:MAG TPA: SAM-dependent methyltransferase, partial [Arenibacter sp.]|nr:SAM-dependent methyltransferase [Arenibacter sp.]